MKSRAKTLIKGLLMATLLSTLLVGCGKNNETGRNNTSTGDYGVYGNSSNAVAAVIAETPCLINGQGGNQGNQRIKIEMPNSGQYTQVPNAGAVHVGITIEGDVLVVSNAGNQARVEIYACQRAGVSNQPAQLVSQVVLNTSDYCNVGEVTAATYAIQSQYGYIPLNFAALDIVNMFNGTNSSQCNNTNSNGNYNNGGFGF